VLLAEPVLALSREAAEELPEETPDEEKACGKVSNPWSEGWEPTVNRLSSRGKRLENRHSYR
jgi:hypothetical protein